jgi:dTDP-4-dehydrorhamnose 3,5-epimerase
MARLAANPMVFTKTRLNGAFIIESERLEDERGYFARTYCQQEFQAHGLNPRAVQSSLSYNSKRGTLRGMHLQKPPYQEAKLVRCVRGALYDVAVDLRENSPTWGQWTAVELKAEKGRPPAAFYIPEGFAHGFQTLEDDTEIFYQMSEFYVPESGAGFRWNDPAFSIQWPLPVSVISERDRTFPDFERFRTTVA